MDDRIRALVESSEWLAPHWPEIHPRTGGADVLVKRPRGQLSPKAQKAIRKAAPDSADALIEAAVAAVAEYEFDCKMDWSGYETARNARERVRMIKRLERWVKPLREWRKTNEKFQATKEESSRLGRHLFAYPEDLLALRRAAPASECLVSAVDAVVKDLKKSGRNDRGRRGPVGDIELRRLVYRLGMAWETLTDDRIADHPIDPRKQVRRKTKNQSAKSVPIEWAFRDVVAAVFESVKDAPTSDLNGVRIVSELVEHHRDPRK